MKRDENGRGNCLRKGIAAIEDRWVQIVFCTLATALPVAASALPCTSGVALMESPGWNDEVRPVAPTSKFEMAARQCGWTAENMPESTSGTSAKSAAPHEAEQLSMYTARAPGTTVSPSQALFATASADPIASLAAAPSPTSSRVNPSAPALASGLSRTSRGQRIYAVAPALARAARQFDIDPLLLHALAHVESRHNPVALSSAGARGLMQVMPATARRFGVNDPHRELWDADTNVRVSAEYLKTLQARFGNNLPLVLAAYNAGEGAVEKYGRKVPPYRETQDYVRQVIDMYMQLRAAAQRQLVAAPAREILP